MPPPPLCAACGKERSPTCAGDAPPCGEGLIQDATKQFCLKAPTTVPVVVVSGDDDPSWLIYVKYFAAALVALILLLTIFVFLSRMRRRS
jgi:hypothetical protein